MDSVVFDLAVVGGGINGAGIASEAQNRGLKTVLIEKNDLASATSSASSKLIHGGLRYLEHYEFRLVRESLNERELLLKAAPFLVKPLRFIMPHESHLRPAWMIRLGLFLYDHLGRRDILPASRTVDFDHNSPLKSAFTKGFEYSDCWVDDARLVALKAMQCAEAGGEILTRHTCEDARPENNLWLLGVRNRINGQEQVIRARALVNAAGASVNDFLEQGLNTPSRHHIRLIRGSHIVVPRLFPGDNAYILQNRDGRIVFVIPYLDAFTMIGTTDVEHTDATDNVKITEDEIHYLCDTVNGYFRQQTAPSDIVWTFSGLRALFSDDDEAPQKISRDYSLEMVENSGPPLISVFGGKLTTFRKLSEKAVDMLAPHFTNLRRSDRTMPLPGGHLPGALEDHIQALAKQYPFLSSWTLNRLATSYGDRVHRILGNAGTLQDLGLDFGCQFTTAEVDYLMAHEFAKAADDILWRRTKMGLFLNDSQQQALVKYLAAKYSPTSDP
jgi:glycerol-3-phosphate dehydrogenase